MNKYVILLHCKIVPKKRHSRKLQCIEKKHKYVIVMEQILLKINSTYLNYIEKKTYFEEIIHFQVLKFF